MNYTYDAGFPIAIKDAPLHRYIFKIDIFFYFTFPFITELIRNIFNFKKRASFLGNPIHSCSHFKNMNSRQP